MSTKKTTATAKKPVKPLFQIHNTGSRNITLHAKGGMHVCPAFGDSNPIELDSDGKAALEKSIKRFPELSVIDYKASEAKSED